MIHFYDFWIKNFTGPYLRLLDPETAVFLRFLDAEIEPFSLGFNIFLIVDVRGHMDHMSLTLVVLYLDPYNKNGQQILHEVLNLSDRYPELGTTYTILRCLRSRGGVTAHISIGVIWSDVQTRVGTPHIVTCALL